MNWELEAFIQVVARQVVEAVICGAISYRSATVCNEISPVTEEAKVAAGIFGAATSLIESRNGVQDRIKTITLVFINTITAIAVFNSIVFFKQPGSVVLGSIAALSVSAIFMRNLSEWIQRFHLCALSAIVSSAQYFALGKKMLSGPVALLGGAIAGFYYVIFGDTSQLNQDLIERIEEIVKFTFFTFLGGWAFKGIVSAIIHSNVSGSSG